MDNKRTDAQLSQTIYTGQPTCSTKIELHDGSFLHLPLLHAIATHVINPFMLGCSLKNLFAYPYVCRAKTVCPQTLSKKEPQNAPQTSPQTPPQFFLEVREILRTRMFQVCGHVCGHICGQVLRALLAGGVCEGDLREELVVVYRSCFAEQTHTMEVLVGAASAVASYGKGNRTRYSQVTPTKVPAIKPRAHAVSHGRTIGEGVRLRPFLVWHAT